MQAPDAAALSWLPLVGAVVGALAGLAAEGIAQLANHALAVATAFALVVVLTGAIHIDGFLDGCDAFFASVPAERRLEILKDPRHGTFALAGFAIALALWFAALWSLAPATYPFALAFAGAGARWSSVVHALYVPYGRPNAVTPAFERRPPLAVLALGLALVVALAWPFGIRGAAALAVTIVLAALCVGWIRPRLGGGLVGDAYGFTIVVAEIGALAVLALTSVPR
ncbi:MAG: adenosylcobinamide-GDP ribazoletransferase [Vulcanimicrobiaceae bacterium]